MGLKGLHTACRGRDVDSETLARAVVNGDENERGAFIACACCAGIRSPHFVWAVRGDAAIMCLRTSHMLLKIWPLQTLFTHDATDALFRCSHTASPRARLCLAIAFPNEGRCRQDDANPFRQSFVRAGTGRPPTNNRLHSSLSPGRIVRGFGDAPTTADPGYCVPAIRRQ
jgi:hypothetical protein